MGSRAQSLVLVVIGLGAACGPVHSGPARDLMEQGRYDLSSESLPLSMQAADAGLSSGSSAQQANDSPRASRCKPRCLGKQCGPDGCGGVCGTCAADQSCSATGQCAASTLPPANGTTAWAPNADDTSWANVASFGAVGDGVTDDTAAFRAAAAAGKKLFIPKPPVAYKLTSYVRVQDSVVGDGSMPLIKMHGATGRWDNTIKHGHGGHVMFALDHYAGSGALFQGLHLDGGYDGTQTSGEFDHLIQIRGSTNVVIAFNQLDNPVGDAVLLGGEGILTPSQNVIIRNNRMSNPRRCNVAVIWARHVQITDNTLEKSNDYVSAIDIEPNPNNREDAWDIEIARNTFKVPRQTAVLLYTIPGVKVPTGGNISIHDNKGTALRFFGINAPGNWSNVTVTSNF